MRAIDLTGKKFGRLRVKKFLESRQVRERKRRIYLCKCKCGNFKEISGDDLSRKAVKSCGCLRKRCGAKNPLWKGFGEISGNHWDHIKRNSKLKKRNFKITIKQVWRLFLKQNRKCALSGIDLTFGKNKTASLDRIDSNKGYIISNVQWIHKDINFMKMDCEEEKFIKLCCCVAKWRNNVC